MMLEVLVASVNKNPRELAEKMHINSKAIIINQCDKNDYEEFYVNNHLIKVYHFNERGVGLSRNNALMRATSDIVLFADEDEVLVDNYEKLIVEEFEKNKNSDMIVFDIDTGNTSRSINKILKRKRVRKYNCLKYGAVRFAAKLKKIRKNNINFSLLFGGGTLFGSGEDSIFIYDCINNGFKIYTSPIIIANVDMSDSSWFKGYNEKFYFDKGALFYALHKNLCYIFILLYLLKHFKSNSSLNIRNRFIEMKKGAIYLKKRYM